MRFDTIIVGGGLSSLVCGIKLQKGGRKCLIVSAGQNALHFSSGTFGLFGKLPDGQMVTKPMDVLSSLPDEHPYSKIGEEKMREYCKVVPDFFSACGVELHPVSADDPESPVNGFRLTPMGTMRPAWLAMKDTTLFPTRDGRIGDKALIVNFAGFLDFNTRFIAEGLEKRGTACRIERVRMKDVENLRKNPSEMRSVGIARLMNLEENWKGFCHMVRDLMSGEDIVILPEVFGFGDAVVTEWMREMIPAKVVFVGTMPPSVPGIRAQMLLKKAFEAAGGTFLAGDTALGSVFERDRVVSIHTSNLGDFPLEADHFVLASGNLFGKGLEAGRDEVREPVFELDTVYPQDRDKWYDKDFTARQEYGSFGVRTDSWFKAFRFGQTVDNLYVIGSQLAGCNTLYEGSGAGVAILSAMYVADNILSD